MQEIKKRINFGDVLIIIIIASLTFMIIPAWIPILRKGWQLLVFATAIILLNRYGYNSPRALIALFIYWLILIFNALLGDVYIGTVTFAIYDFLVLFVSSSIAFYCVSSGNEKFVRLLVYITFIALIVELIASLIVLETDPGMIRRLYAMSKEESDTQFMYSFYKLGIMDYSMGHAIPILIPPLFCYFKEGLRKEKWICLLLLAACISLIWLSESSTALLLMVLMVFMGLLMNGKSSILRKVLTVLLVLLIFIVLMSYENIVYGIFEFLKNIIGDDSQYTDRIGELQLSVIEGQTTGDLEARKDLYKISIDMFLSNIFFGSNLMPGRHSGFLDRLATLGLVGFIPLLFFFFFSLKAIWVSIPQSRRIYYLECIIAAFLMLLFKAMWLWPIFLFLFVISPCMLVMKQDKQ